MRSASGQDLCQVRSETDSPCGRPAAATSLGMRFCERCAREQQDYFAVGELTQVPRGKSGATEGVWYAAKLPRSGCPAEPMGGRRGQVARSIKVSLVLVVASVSLLASAACGGAGQAGGGSAAAEAEAEREATAQERARPAEATAEGKGGRGAVARAGDADGAFAHAGGEGGAVARADGAQARAGDTAREDGEEPARDAAGEDRAREDPPRGSKPRELTLKVDGDPGAAFSGVCSAGKEEKTIEGRVPQRYVFEPDDAGLECEIRKEGRGTLEVVVAGGGVRSVQRTGAGEGTIKFALSDGGISSLRQTVTASERSSADAFR